MDLEFIDFFFFFFSLTGATGNNGLMKVKMQCALTSCLYRVALLGYMSVCSTKALH